MDPKKDYLLALKGENVLSKILTYIITHTIWLSY